MRQYKTSVILISIVLLNIDTNAFAQNFDHARQLINNAQRPIDYDNFCLETPEGGDKIACRVGGAPGVAFLVCKTSTVDDEECRNVIANEIANLATVEAGGVRTVLVDPPQIDDVTCGQNSADETCSGFLEEWVGTSRGQFKHIRDRIVDQEIQELIDEVKAFVPPAGRPTTVANLQAIKTFMEAHAPVYRQICDLQGFFLIQGGFMVNDVPYVLDNAGLHDECWPGEPTTQQVLNALDALIAGFQ